MYQIQAAPLALHTNCESPRRRLAGDSERIATWSQRTGHTCARGRFLQACCVGRAVLVRAYFHLQLLGAICFAPTFVQGFALVANSTSFP